MTTNKIPRNSPTGFITALVRILIVLLPCAEPACAYDKVNSFLFGFLYNSIGSGPMTFRSQLGAVCAGRDEAVLADIAQTQTLYVSIAGRNIKAKFAGMTVNNKPFDAAIHYCHMKGTNFYDNTYVSIKLTDAQAELPAIDAAAIIATSPPPEQTWSATAAKCSGVPQLPDKQLKSLGSSCKRITTANGELLMLRSVTLDDSASEDPADTYSCQIYRWRGRRWHLLLMRTTEYLPCKPLLDVEGSGVPEFFVYDIDPVGPALYRVQPASAALYRLGDESDTAW